MKVKVKETFFEECKTIRDVVREILRRDLTKYIGVCALEVGCGRWSYAKDILERNRCKWYGVEPVDFGDQNITLIRGGVKKLPFHNDSFDLILCTQTIEHWFEYGVSISQGLSELRRVLSQDGVIMINAPIHVHGNPIFLRGELDKVEREFRRANLQITLLEKCYSATNVKRWKKISNKGFFSTYGYPSFLIPNSDKAYSYILNIHATSMKEDSKKTTIDSGLKRYVLVAARFLKSFVRTRFY